MPYQLNNVSIDPEGASQDVEFENTAQRVAPRAGAVVKVKFRTNTGIPVLITSDFGGEKLPFGADVYDENNAHVGNVTQGGTIYARVSKQKGNLTVKWAEGQYGQCKVSYMLAPLKTGEWQNAIPQQFNENCVSVRMPSDIKSGVMANQRDSY